MKAKIEQEMHVEIADKTGILGQVLATVAKAGVGMEAMAAYAQGKRGHFIMVTSDNAKAARALQKAGYSVEADEVVVAEFDDKRGAGAGIAQKLADAGIYTEYAYAGSRGKKVLLALSTSDNDSAVRLLNGKKK